MSARMSTSEHKTLPNTSLRTPPLTREGKPRAFFGRRSGKTLHGRQAELMETLLPELEIGFGDQTDRLVPMTPFATPQAPLVLEIGYGGGEHLARQAMENPGTNFIGAEVFSNSIGKMLEKIADNDLGNIRLFSFDALDLLRDLPEAALDGVYLLYPDPWPKSRHHKRRFVSPTTMAELARTIRPGGFFRFATDIGDYATWTLAHVLRSPDFTWAHGAPGDWHQPYDGWQATRYEQKAREEGRLQSWYFTFRRIN